MSDVSYLWSSEKFLGAPRVDLTFDPRQMLRDFYRMAEEARNKPWEPPMVMLSPKEYEQWESGFRGTGEYLLGPHPDKEKRIAERRAWAQTVEIRRR